MLYLLWFFYYFGKEVGTRPIHTDVTLCRKDLNTKQQGAQAHCGYLCRGSCSTMCVPAPFSIVDQAVTMRCFLHLTSPPISRRTVCRAIRYDILFVFRRSHLMSFNIFMSNCYMLFKFDVLTCFPNFCGTSLELHHHDVTILGP